jgi:short-subunit dehydrogenase
MLLRPGDVALVTGTSRGLGPHIARALAARSVHLVLAARSEEALQKLATELRQHSVEVLVVAADLRHRGEIMRLLATAQGRFGAVDLLVNNAGLAEGVRFEHTTLDELDEMIDLNLRAPMALSQRLWPDMLARGRGHVVNIASMAGLFGSAHNEGYCATKHALVGFTRALRMSAQDAGSAVSATVVCPGFMDGAGQFESMKRDFAVRAPRSLGSVRASALGPAVIRAIEANLPELVVTGKSQRPALTLQAVAPRLFEWAARLSGVNALFREVADRRLSLRAVSGAEVTEAAVPTQPK